MFTIINTRPMDNVSVLIKTTYEILRLMVESLKEASHSSSLNSTLGLFKTYEIKTVVGSINMVALSIGMT